MTTLNPAYANQCQFLWTKSQSDQTFYIKNMSGRLGTLEQYIRYLQISENYCGAVGKIIVNMGSTDNHVYMTDF
jgi:hypothetical protein